MSQTPKISIGKTVNSGPKPVKSAIKSSSKPGDPKVLKSAQTDESNSGDSNSNDSTDGEFVTDDGGSWEAGKPISKGYEEKALNTMRSLAQMQYDLERAKLDHERGINKDNLDANKQAQEFQAQQAQQAMYGQLAQGALSGLGGLFSGGGSKGGGGSSGGGGSAPSSSKPGPSPEEMAFEDQKNVEKLDAKGKPITTKPGDTKSIQAQNPSNQALAQNTSNQNLHNQVKPELTNTNAKNFDEVNGFSIDTHNEISNQALASVETVNQARTENEANIDFNLSQENQFAQVEEAETATDIVDDVDSFEDIEELA